MTTDLTFDALLEMLELHRQRATSRAVGGYLGRTPGSLMTGLPRTPRHSWIVSQGTRLPRNYEPAEQHPELESKSFVLLTADEIRKWLGNKAAQTARARRANEKGRSASAR